MNDDLDHSKTSGPGPELRRILLEALLVTTVGAAVAFAANRISPRGLALTRNYFPGTTNGTVSAPILPLAAGIKQKGLQWVVGRQAARLFGDPRFKQQLVVFIDARDEQHYQEGHIPGAYEFDPYHPERYFAAVLPLCQAAEDIVVYCKGGDCEDSQFAAIALRDAGIANQKLFVFAGGMAEWTAARLPVEIGERNSGKAPE